VIFRGKTIDGQPAARWDKIQDACVKYGHFVIEVRKLDENREISLQQKAWLHCNKGPIALLAKHKGCSKLDAENTLKKECAGHLFIKEISGELHILSKSTLTVKQTTEWMENIFDYMESIECPVLPPDPNWKINQKKSGDKT